MEILIWSKLLTSLRHCGDQMWPMGLPVDGRIHLFAILGLPYLSAVRIEFSVTSVTRVVDFERLDELASAIGALASGAS
jgi:hypothetical protein